MINRSGIYKITCTTNGRSYVGSAVKVRARWALHTHQAEKNKHHSKHFQRAWNKHGRDAFKFEILLVCDKSDLLMYEQRAIDVLKPKFNMTPVAGSTLGLKHSAEQNKANSERCKAIHGTPEARARMSEQALARYNDPEYRARMTEVLRRNAAARSPEQLRAKYTEEVRAKLSASAKNRAKTYDILGAKLSALGVEGRYGVSKAVFLSRIRRGWSPELAAVTPPDQKHTVGGARTHEYKGSMHTIAELAHIAQCSKSAIWRRISSGISVADAVEMTTGQAEAWRIERMIAGRSVAKEAK